MKGYFHLRADPYTGELAFGNLSSEGATLGYLNDAIREDSYIGGIVAHDVVEHSLSQRKKTYITHEEEFRALGAVEFVRQGEILNIEQDIINNLEYVHRELNPVPKIMVKYLVDNYYVCPDRMKRIIADSECDIETVRRALHHVAWGRFQKECQFNGEHYFARRAFGFIKANIKYAISQIYENDSYGASIYFDSDNEIFRTRMRWR